MCGCHVLGEQVRRDALPASQGLPPGWKVIAFHLCHQCGNRPDLRFSELLGWIAPVAAGAKAP